MRMARKFALNANKITKREHVNWFDQLIQNQIIIIVIKKVLQMLGYYHLS